MPSPKRIVAALGGNAITRPGEPADIPSQFGQTSQTCRHLADLVASGNDLVITHGNGPQVGFILRRVELAARELHTLPLEICVADSQGGMGYMITQCLTNELNARGISKRVSSLLTTVLVSQTDPALDNPTKPIGSFLTSEEAEVRSRVDGWVVKEIEPGQYRRVVPSPVPTRILEHEAISDLVNGGHLLVVCGGGGIPVVQADDGAYRGVAAVIDKDFASALLAVGIEADCLLILTAVGYVSVDFGTPQQRELEQLSIREAKEYLSSGQFPEGSMGPKIDAAIRFLTDSTKTEAEVVITDPDHVLPALEGRYGTRITRS